MEKKVKEIRSELVSYEGGIATFKLLDQLDVDKVQELAKDGKFYAYIDFVDERDRSEAQRRHFYALIGDISEGKHIHEDSAELMIKAEYAEEHGLDYLPSMKKRKMSRKMATKMIEFTVNWMIWNDVPFRKNMFYLTEDTSKILYALTMNRKCWVTGRPGAELHHAINLVGMGGDRTKYNHLDSKFMMLSREAHNEIHNIGLTEFMNKYHLGPIKLDERDLKNLEYKGSTQRRMRMDKEQVSKTYMWLHDRWEKARGFRLATEPESHENGFHQGMEHAYKKMMEELSIHDMIENDGMTREETKGWHDKIENM